MKRMIFEFDRNKCTACCACSLACMDQNDIKTECGQHPFRNAFEYENLWGQKPVFSNFSISCMHCEDAPCVTACPTGCLYKDDESGLTLFDNDSCIKCRSCAMACPFGAPSYDLDGRMVKCDGCIERLRAGLAPACTRVCPTAALSCVPEDEYHKRQSKHAIQNIAKYILQGD